MLRAWAASNITRWKPATLHTTTAAVAEPWRPAIAAAAACASAPIAHFSANVVVRAFDRRSFHSSAIRDFARSATPCAPPQRPPRRNSTPRREPAADPLFEPPFVPRRQSEKKQHSKRKHKESDAAPCEDAARLKPLRHPPLPSPPPPPPRPPADNPTCFEELGSSLSPMLSRLGALSTSFQHDLRCVYMMLRYNEFAAFRALSPAAAAYLFTVLALAELSPTLLSCTGIRSPPPYHRKPIQPRHHMHMFVRGQIELLQQQLHFYKESPLDATLAQSLRSSLHAVYLSVHALGSTQIVDAFAEPARGSRQWNFQSNDNDDEESDGPDAFSGGNVIKTRTNHPFDYMLFPHIPQVNPHVTVPLLEQLEQCMLDHLDLFLFPPGTPLNDDLFKEQPEGEAKNEAASMSAAESAVATDPSKPAFVVRSDVVCNGSSTLQLYPDETASYPHHRPWRNVIAWVRVLQSVRGGYAARGAIRALLRSTAVPIMLLNIMRKRRAPNFAAFAYSDEEYLSLSEKRGDAGAQNAATTEANDNADAPAAAAENAEGAAGAAAGAGAIAEKDDDEKDDDAGALEKVDEDQDPALDAQDREESQRIQQMENEAAGESAVPAVAAPAVPVVPRAVSLLPPPSANMWFGSRMRASDMVCLVEAWALNNLNAGRMLNAMHRWLQHRSTNLGASHWSFLSLIEVVRLMECFGLMEWNHPLTHGLAEHAARFLRGPDRPLGQPLDIMTVLATDLQDARALHHVEEILQRLGLRGGQPKREDGASSTDTSSTGTPSAVSSVPTSAAPSTEPTQPPAVAAAAFALPWSTNRAPLLFAHLLSLFLRRYGPLAMMRCDIPRQSVELARLTARMELKTGALMVSIRAMSDYFMRLMEDNETAAAMRLRHISSKPNAATYDSAVGDVQLLSELTDFAWALVLRQVESFAVVQHFMHAYMRWVDRIFMFHTVNDRCTLTHHRGVELGGDHRILFRMHQVSLSMSLAPPTPSPFLTSMPREFPVPALPAEINFSAGTRDALLQYHKSQGRGDRSVSQLQMQVYQLMSDPQYGMGFRQRVLHDHLRVTMNRDTASHHLEKEQELNSALYKDPFSPQAMLMLTADEEGDELVRLRDRMDSEGVATEHSSESSAVDFFVEHSSAIGYTLDAAIVMRTTVDPNQKGTNLGRKSKAPPQRLADLPAIRALLPDTVAAPTPTLRTLSVALEIDGPFHYSRSSAVQCLNARSRLRRRHLRAHGWIVVSVPYSKWNDLNNDEERQAEFLRSLLPATLLLHRRQWAQSKRVEQRHERIARTQQLRQYINEVGSTVITSPQHATRLLRQKFASTKPTTAAASSGGPRSVTPGRKFIPGMIAPTPINAPMPMSDSTSAPPTDAASAAAAPVDAAAAKQANLRAILDKFKQKAGNGLG